ncbi:Pr6Pr family membrane protein [Primorskyibacter sp. S187A]|uniref:Pr6Pr family membrane protein n=1 Tax=Primorskyibacter sp. S187A TaxID=3415130 RepID=UPI003C79F7CD
MIMRVSAGILALSVLGTLLLRIQLNMATGNSFPEALWVIYRFFTVWTNTAIGVVALLIACARPVSDNVQSALLLAIGAVSIVYHVLLAHLVSYEGVERFVDVMLHSVVPLGWLAFWVVFTPKARLRFRAIPWWLLYPLVYCVYALVRGAFDGVYPYPFLNVEKLGLGGVAINVLGLLIVFSIGAAAIVVVGRLLAHRSG